MTAPVFPISAPAPQGPSQPFTGRGSADDGDTFDDEITEAASRAREKEQPKPARKAQPSTTSTTPNTGEKPAKQTDSNESAVATTYILVAREAVDPLALALDSQPRVAFSDPPQTAMEAIEITTPPQVPANDPLFETADLAFAAQLSSKDGVAADDTPVSQPSTETPDASREAAGSKSGPELRTPPRPDAGLKPLPDARIAARNYQAAGNREDRIDREPLAGGAEEAGARETGVAVRTTSAASLFQAPATAVRPGGAEVAPQVLNPVEQIRGSESRVGEAAAPQQPLRDLSVRISDAGHESVELKIMERGGDIRVAVRTPDIDLSRSLRGGLSDLVARLDRIGYQAETWRPAETAGSSAEHGHGRGSSGDAQPRQGSAGHSSGSSQGQHQERQPRPQPHWFEEMQKDFTTSERVQFPWLRP